MTMDGQRVADGQWAIRLGPVEKWIVSAAAALLTVALGLIYSRIDTQLDRQSEAMAALTTQQAVMTSQLTALNAQLANVPDLTQRVSRLEVRADALEEQTRELRQTRGLR